MAIEMADWAVLEEFISLGVKSLIGDGFTLALVLLLLFLLLVIFSRLDLTVGLMIMIPLLLILTAYQGFPAWVMVIIILGMIFILYSAVKVLLNQ